MKVFDAPPAEVVQCLNPAFELYRRFRPRSRRRSRISLRRTTSSLFLRRRPRRRPIAALLHLLERLDDHEQRGHDDQEVDQRGQEPAVVDDAFVDGERQVVEVRLATMTTMICMITSFTSEFTTALKRRRSPPPPPGRARSPASQTCGSPSPSCSSFLLFVADPCCRHPNVAIFPHAVRSRPLAVGWTSHPDVTMTCFPARDRGSGCRHSDERLCRWLARLQRRVHAPSGGIVRGFARHDPRRVERGLWEEVAPHVTGPLARGPSTGSRPWRWLATGGVASAARRRAARPGGATGRSWWSARAMRAHLERCAHDRRASSPRLHHTTGSAARRRSGRSSTWAGACRTRVRGRARYGAGAAAGPVAPAPGACPGVLGAAAEGCAVVLCLLEQGIRSLPGPRTSGKRGSACRGDSACPEPQVTTRPRRREACGTSTWRGQSEGRGRVRRVRPIRRRRVFDDDRARQNDLVAAGWTVFRVTEDDVRRRSGAAPFARSPSQTPSNNSPSCQRNRRYLLSSGASVRRRSTTMAMPWPPPTHMLSSP